MCKEGKIALYQEHLWPCNARTRRHCLIVTSFFSEYKHIPTKPPTEFPTLERYLHIQTRVFLYVVNSVLNLVYKRMLLFHLWKVNLMCVEFATYFLARHVHSMYLIYVVELMKLYWIAWKITLYVNVGWKYHLFCGRQERHAGQKWVKYMHILFASLIIYLIGR